MCDELNLRGHTSGSRAFLTTLTLSVVVPSPCYRTHATDAFGLFRPES